MLYEFINDVTKSPFKYMYDHIISPVKSKHKIDLLDPKTKLTYYKNYIDSIKSCSIELPEWPEWYILTVTSTNSNKLIPIMSNNNLAIIDMIITLINVNYQNGFTMMVFHASKSITRNGIYVSNKMTHVLTQMFGNPIGQQYIRTYSSSPEYCFLTHDPDEAYFSHLKYGLANGDLKRIMVTFNRHILILIRIMLEKKKRLIEEIMEIDINRALCVQDILNNHITDVKQDHINLLQKLWPKLEVIVAGNSGNFRIYGRTLAKYIGNVKIYSPIYASAESVYGYNIDQDGYYVLDPTMAFFEFIHIDKKYINSNKGKVISMRNLILHQYYVLVVSTSTTNLRRYVTGDVIKVMGFYHNTPKIELICKVSDLILLAERDTFIIPWNIEDVLFKHFDLIDYCYVPIENGYNLYIELDAASYLHNKKEEDVEDKCKKVKVKKILFDEFKLNMDVFIVKERTFDDLHESRCYGEVDGLIDQAQTKMARMIKSKSDIDILHENIVFRFQ